MPTVISGARRSYVSPKNPPVVYKILLLLFECLAKEYIWVQDYNICTASHQVSDNILRFYNKVTIEVVISSGALKKLLDASIGPKPK